MRLAFPLFSLLLVLALTPADLSAVPQNAKPRDPVLDAMVGADRTGHPAKAEKILRHAIHKAERSEPLSPKLATYLDALAGVREDETLHKNKLDKKVISEAIALRERALAIDEDTLGPSDRTVEEGLSAIGQSLTLQGNQDEAERILKRALEIARTNPNVSEIERFSVLMNLGWLYERERRWIEAEQTMQEVQHGCTGDLKKYGPCASVDSNIQMLYRNAGKGGKT